MAHLFKHITRTARKDIRHLNKNVRHGVRDATVTKQLANSLTMLLT